METCGEFVTKAWGVWIRFKRSYDWLLLGPLEKTSCLLLSAKWLLKSFQTNFYWSYYFLFNILKWSEGQVISERNFGVLNFPIITKFLDQKIKHNSMLMRNFLLFDITKCRYFWFDTRGYSWVPNRRVYSFIWHQRNMKKERHKDRQKYSIKIHPTRLFGPTRLIGTWEYTQIS